MPEHPRLPLVVAAIIALVLTSCSDDSPTSSSNRDTTPPQITNVAPIDEFHVDITFSEEIDKASAETVRHYQITEAAVASLAGPGDPLYVGAAILHPDRKTVSLATYNAMSAVNLTISVDGVADLEGNAITGLEQTFIGSDLPDDDAPQIAGTTPAEGATNAPIRTTVTIQFNEPIDDNYFGRNVTWTSPGGAVPFYRDYNSTRGLTIVAIGPLEYNALQTIAMSGIRDRSGNIMPDASFSFRTTSVRDDTPPRLVSSYPPNNAVNVSVTTHFSLTFSEPIDQFNFELEYVPDMLFDEWEWSDDGMTLSMTLRDYAPLRENQQYIFTLYPGGVYDLGTNTVTAYEAVVFTTGSRLEAGSIKGRVFGDPGTGAADPTGAVVIAESWFAYNLGIVALNNTYIVPHLELGPYYVAGYLDSNHDGYISTFSGDALGGYGADLSVGDAERTVVLVFESRHVTEVDFSLFDPTAASGIVTYSGEPLAPWRPLNVGLFKTTADAANLTHPVAISEGWWPYDEQWLFNNLFQEFPEGDYYLAAYIDVDSSGAYEAGTDAAGAYGGFESPTPVHMANGKDHFQLVLPVIPPVSGTAPRVTWPAPRRNPEFQRLAEIIAKRQPKSKSLNVDANSSMRDPHQGQRRQGS